LRGPDPLTPDLKVFHRIGAPTKDEHEIFVFTNDRFLCESCAADAGVDLSLDEVQVWEEYSSGWTAPVLCAVCALSIPVYVDAEEVA
jgi:hypothetical protein